MAAVKRSIMLTDSQDAFVEAARRRGWKRSTVIQWAVDAMMRDPPLFLRDVPTSGSNNNDPVERTA